MMKNNTMMKNYLRLSIALLSTIICVSTWAAAPYIPNPATAKMDNAPLVEILNAKRTFPGILSGGQPTDEQLIQAKNKGYKTIINLRPTSEHQGDKEANKVRELGMAYINIPVKGASGINSENSQALIKALSDSNNYPVMVHCASGNRVGALFALDAAQRSQLSTEEAIKVGKQAGLTQLEDVVRNVLEP